MSHKTAKRIRKMLKVSGLDKQELREYDHLLPSKLKPSYTNINKVGSFRGTYRMLKSSLKEQ